LLEKESSVGSHQSTHNSGVLHAGLYYRPGSLKARLAVEGIRAMTAYCREKNIPHEICGKVVVAVDASEVPRLHELEARGLANGLTGLRRLDRASSERGLRREFAEGCGESLHRAALLVGRDKWLNRCTLHSLGHLGGDGGGLRALQSEPTHRAVTEGVGRQGRLGDHHPE
jgi:hypothetical protein